MIFQSRLVFAAVLVIGLPAAWQKAVNTVADYIARLDSMIAER